MAKKLRAFFDPARDEQIREGGPDWVRQNVDAELLSLVSHTELVQLCNLVHPNMRAHVGIDREYLEEALFTAPAEGWKNPIDKYRSRLSAFIKSNWDKISDQMEMDCTGDCYQCHDLMVLGCYVTNADHLKESPEEG